jgi:hypothetical protein
VPRPKKLKPPELLTPGVSLNIDWKAYFDDFCAVHGDPVEVGGRALFPDGWAYGIQSYQGPEWMPPDDPEALRQLQISYWDARYKYQYGNHAALKNFLLNLMELQQRKTLPLKHRVRSVKDNDYGETVTHWESVEIDLTVYKLKLKEMAADISNCKSNLSELGVGIDGSTHQRTIRVEATQAVDPSH